MQGCRIVVATQAESDCSAAQGAAEILWRKKYEVGLRVVLPLPFSIALRIHRGTGSLPTGSPPPPIDNYPICTQGETHMHTHLLSQLFWLWLVGSAVQ